MDQCNKKIWLQGSGVELQVKGWSRWSLPLEKLPKSSLNVRQFFRRNGFSLRQVNPIRKEAILGTRQAEMLAQRGRLVVAPKKAAALQLGRRFVPGLLSH